MKPEQYKFNLQDDYVLKVKTKWTSSEQVNSLVALPTGIYEIRINTFGKPVKNYYKCYFTNGRTSCVLINVGFGIQVSGDILITLIELGYNLASKDDWEKIKKEKENIVKSYNRLLSEKPELFNKSDFFEDIQEKLKNRMEELRSQTSIIETQLKKEAKRKAEAAAAEEKVRQAKETADKVAAAAKKKETDDKKATDKAAAAAEEKVRQAKEIADKAAADVKKSVTKKPAAKKSVTKKPGKFKIKKILVWLGIIVVGSLIGRACNPKPDPCECTTIMMFGKPRAIQFEGYYVPTHDEEGKKEYERCEDWYDNRYGAEAACIRKNMKK